MMKLGLLGAARPVILGAVLGVVAAAGIMLAPPLADAKASYQSAYGYDRTWNASLRLVRVDLGLKITEKDDASGYLLFDYTSPDNGNKAVPGSLELVRGATSDDPVEVIVQLPQMPHYHEQVMIDELAAKMRAEYGDPPPRKKKDPPAPPPAPPDAGVDSGEN
jgi:hypothetical protein